MCSAVRTDVAKLGNTVAAYTTHKRAHRAGEAGEGRRAGGGNNITTNIESSALSSPFGVVLPLSARLRSGGGGCLPAMPCPPRPSPSPLSASQKISVDPVLVVSKSRDNRNVVGTCADLVQGKTNLVCTLATFLIYFLFASVCCREWVTGLRSTRHNACAAVTSDSCDLSPAQQCAVNSERVQ